MKGLFAFTDIKTKQPIYQGTCSLSSTMMYVNKQADNCHTYFKTLHLLLYSINIDSEEKHRAKALL